MKLEALVGRAAEGDPAAFAELVGRSRDLVYAICLGELGPAAEVEDLTQEVFVRVHRDLADLREPGKFLPWLRQVARNVCRMWLRRQQPSYAPLEAVADKGDPASGAQLRRLELGQIVAGMLAQVSEKSREVLTLHYLGGCSEAEIAATLGLPPTTVKSRLHEGRQQAKRELLPVVEELLSLRSSSEEIVEQVLARCGSPDCLCAYTLTEGR